MKRKNTALLGLLKTVDFGSSVAELDDLLQIARVETSAFNDVFTDKVDLVPGTKGSGKSALFRIFTDFLPDTLLVHRKVVVAHGVQKQGDLIFQAYQKEFEKLTEDEFVDFWCIYLVSLAHEQFIKGPRYAKLLVGREGDIQAFRRACERANIPDIKGERTFREILGWALNTLRQYTPRLKYHLPQEGGTVELDLFGNQAEPLSKRAAGQPEELGPPTYVIDIKETLEVILAKSNVSIWLMVDKLDELFPRRSSVESKALRGLLRAMRIFSSKEIRVKVFLRDDMLENLLSSGEGFTALTHLTARQADTLKWSEDQILTVIVNRFYSNKSSCVVLDVSRDRLAASLEYRREAFYKIFPLSVHKGSRQSNTLRWIYSHACDANGVVTPRDVIDLLTKAKQRRQDELSADLMGESEDVISSASIQYGYEELSVKKRTTYLQAEFPHLWPQIEKFCGGKASYSEHGMQKVLGPKWRNTVADFLAIGLVSGRGEKGSVVYTFPFLYRKGLGITQGADDEGV